MQCEKVALQKEKPSLWERSQVIEVREFAKCSNVTEQYLILF